MRCDYFDAGVCRSCALMGVPYADQLADKQRHVERVLAPVAPDVSWTAPRASAEEGFRNKAKLAVGGVPGAVTLGILDGERRGVDLRHCGLHEPGLAAAIPRLADLVDRLGLTPYDVPGRRGELKYLLVTRSPAGELMVRFVLRSRAELPLVERTVTEGLIDARVVSVNLHPEHKAVLEGETEIVLTERSTLPMDTGAGVVLPLPPRSFFQTNTDVATALYAQAVAWAEDVDGEVWDLYCGVGGFAHHLSGPGRRVTGVETSAEAVRAGGTMTREGVQAPRLIAADATAWALEQPGAPDLVVVNPPRRGLGPDLAGWLERSATRRVLYSSCSVESLARDLAAMPSWRPRRARLFDMFPQTRHHEVLVDLRRD